MFYTRDEVTKIIDGTITQLKASRDHKLVETDALGSFTLRKVDTTWARELMLGVFDYYQGKDISALQIVPDQGHWTIDVPNMSAPWSATEKPVWKWLREPWTYPVRKDSTAITDLAALSGDPVTEACRWEEDEWELFAGAGPDVTRGEMRIVPLGTLLAADASLQPVVHLTIGCGLWRDAASKWHPWLKKGPTSEAERIPEA